MISIKDLPGVAVSCAAAKLLLLVLLISVTVVVGAQEQTSEKMPFAGLVGEYRGTLKRTKMVVWATPVAAPGLGGAVTALMFFPEAERQALVDRLDRMSGDQAALYQRVCDALEITEEGYIFHTDVFRFWHSGVGLALIHGGWDERHFLKPDWRSVTARSLLMINEEYLSIRGREYMVKQVSRSPHTGFIQNFFDNPKLRLTRVETSSAELELLANYVIAKETARRLLNMGAQRLPPEPLPICADLLRKL